MNWITLPINTPPRSVPKDAFVSSEREEPPILNILGDELAVQALSFVPSSAESSLPGSVRARLRGKDPIEPSLIHPPPQILGITGEAVARGVLFPALYGSPALEGGGLYWSATVDTRKQGTFFYDMKIKLSRLAGFTECGQKVWESCILPCRSRIRVVRTCVENGFERFGPRRRPHRGRRARSQQCTPHFYTTGD
jgi:hypothetical protein